MNVEVDSWFLFYCSHFLFSMMISLDNLLSISSGFGQNCKFLFWHVFKLCLSQSVCGIQIEICAEYRDILPRPRLVCQEPGLRPIGQSPGVPDKSSRCLGSMSRYSAQILICFIAYIFSIFNFSVGSVGNLAELPPCTVPPATVHCYQNEAAQCSPDNQISQHA